MIPNISPIGRRVGVGLSLAEPRHVRPAVASVVPPAPAGYDIILGFGDSLVNGIGTNANGGVGYTRDPVLDVDMASVDQINGPDATAAGQTAGAVSSDITPLYGNGALSIDHLCILETVGREWRQWQIANGMTHRKVRLVNMGKNGARIMADANTSGEALAVGGSAHTAAKGQFLDALNLSRAELAGSRIVMMIEAEGSNDAGLAGTLNGSVYQAAKQAGIDDIRDALGFASMPVVLYGPVPGLTGTGATTVRNADIAIDAADDWITRVVCSGSGPDNLHPSSAQMRTDAPLVVAARNAMVPLTDVLAFSVAPVGNAPLSEYVSSAPFLFNGPDVGQAVPISVSGGQYSIDGGATWATSGTVYWGHSIIVRGMSSASNGTMTTVAVTIGSRSANFNVTTFSTGTTRSLMVRGPAFVRSNNRLIQMPHGGAILREKP